MKDCIHGSHNFPFTIVYSLYTIDPATALGEHLSRFFASRSVPGQNGKLTDTSYGLTSEGFVSEGGPGF